MALYKNNPLNTKICLAAVFLYPMLLTSQHTLTIKAEGIKSSHGHIAVGIYDTSHNFLKVDETLIGTFVKAETGTTIIEFFDLPVGTYAVSIFHDVNGNQKLDTNFMGIPKEPVAFSKAKMKMFGPPNFEECAFTLSGDHEVAIKFD